MKAFIVALLACMVALGQCGNHVEIQLSGREIGKHDSLSQSDPFLLVFYKFNEHSNWVSFGRTSVKQDNPNPNWDEKFVFDYTGGAGQSIKYEIWDEDIEYHDLISELEMPLGEIVTSALEHGGAAVERQLGGGNGRLLMKVKIDGVIPAAQPSQGHGPLAQALGMH